MASYEEYLNVLRSGNAILPCYKVEILNENNTTRYVITDDILSDGNLSGKTNNGQRRTANITIYNAHRKYKIAPGYIFYGTKVRLYGGIYVGEEPYYILLGIFYIQKMSSSRGTTTDNISLSLVDKWGKLDGSIFGKTPFRVEYNKSVTKYRNADVVVKAENNNTVSEAALRGNDIIIKNNSGNFTNATHTIDGVSDNYFTKSSLLGEFDIKYSLTACSFSMGGLSSENQIKLSFDNGDTIICYINMNIMSISLNDNIIQSLSIPNFIGDFSFTYDRYTLTCIANIYNDKQYIIDYNYVSNYNFIVNVVTADTRVENIVLSSTSYVINYDYNIYDIIRNTLKKTTRYDIKIIAYIPSEIRSDSENFRDLVNQYLESQLDDISSIMPQRDYIQLVSDNKIYRCKSNDWYPKVGETAYADANTYVPDWELVDISYNDILDNEDPILDPYYEPEYIDSNTVRIYGEDYSRSELPYGLLTLPKSIVQERGQTEGQLLSNLADLLSGEIGYNRYGQLFVKPNGREIKLNEKEVIWRLKYKDYAVLQQKNIDYANLVNYVVVVGNTTDGIELTEYAANEDLESDYAIQKIGVIPYIYKLEYSYDPKDWTPVSASPGEEVMLQYKAIRKNMRELAEWYLIRNKELQSTLSLTCSIIPHIEENKVIEIENAEGKYEKYVIDSFNMPLGFTGTMTMNCTKVV